MNINTNITMGNYSITLTGTVAEKDIAGLVAEGVRSIAYRKVSPKLDIPIANHFGESVIDSKGNPVPKEGFKKKAAAWDADLAPKIASVYEKEYPGFTAKVVKYEPAENKSNAEKVLAAKLAGLELAREFMTEEQYATKVAELKGESVA